MQVTRPVTIPTPEQVATMYKNMTMPELRKAVSEQGIQIVLGVPYCIVDGYPEPDCNDVNGIKVIIEADYRRIWMKAYFPFLHNPPGSGNWTCSSCRQRGDRFHMKGHRDRGMCHGYNEELLNKEKAKELIQTKQKPVATKTPTLV